MLIYYCITYIYFNASNNIEVFYYYFKNITKKTNKNV